MCPLLRFNGFKGCAMSLWNSTSPESLFSFEVTLILQLRQSALLRLISGLFISSLTFFSLFRSIQPIKTICLVNPTFNLVSGWAGRCLRNFCYSSVDFTIVKWCAIFTGPNCFMNLSLQCTALLKQCAWTHIIFFLPVLIGQEENLDWSNNSRNFKFFSPALLSSVADWNICHAAWTLKFSCLNWFRFLATNWSDPKVGASPHLAASFQSV